MEMTGTVLIPAARAHVWRALNDAQVLGRCIPGCEEVREVSPSEMFARVAVKLGPVRARFVGKINKLEMRENEGYRLEFEGSGGTAGFAKGSSQVTLRDEGDETQLSYTAVASVGGKLGQIGGRLIDISARQMADQFFQRFSTQFASASSRPRLVHDDDADATPGASPVAPARNERRGASIPESARVLWFGLGVASTALGVWIGSLLTH